LHQVIVLTRRAVAVQDNDKVGEFTAAVFPASPRVSLFDAGDDPGSRRVDGRSDRHIEVDREFLESSVAETRAIALQDPVTLPARVGQRVKVAVVMNGVFITDGPVEGYPILAIASRPGAGQPHNLLRLSRCQRACHGVRAVNL
jgi:hypothetical protein